MASRGFRSTRRIASTARPATSRTRPRTSTGSSRKAEEARIIRTCKMLGPSVALGVALAAPAAATTVRGRPCPTRNAPMSRRAPHPCQATMFAPRACSRHWPQIDPANAQIARSAVSEAIGAGDMPLALGLARNLRRQCSPGRCSPVARCGGVPAQAAGGGAGLSRNVFARRRSRLLRSVAGRLGSGGARGQEGGAACHRHFAGGQCACPLRQRAARLPASQVSPTGRGGAVRQAGACSRRRARAAASAGFCRRLHGGRRQGRRNCASRWQWAPRPAAPGSGSATANRPVLPSTAPVTRSPSWCLRWRSTWDAAESRDLPVELVAGRALCRRRTQRDRDPARLCCSTRTAWTRRWRMLGRSDVDPLASEARDAESRV